MFGWHWHWPWHHRTTVVATTVGVLAVVGGVVAVTSQPPPGPAPTVLSTAAPAPGYTPLPGDLGVGCGTERWDVKTLTDPLASSVNLAPVDTTVAALRALPAPVNPTGRVAAEEQVVRVTATVTSYKEEADSDIHLAVRDDAGNTMIFELVSPSCVPASVPQRAELGAARNTWLTAHPLSVSFVTVGQRITVTGVRFFDRIHGQRGVAPNGIEIHPVLTIVLS